MRDVFRVFLLIAVASSLSADDLSGVWKAKRRFGPDARGALVIERKANAWSADFAGRVLPVRFDSGKLTFALPDKGGDFQGRLEGDRITGHWITPNSVTNGSRYAMPVTLSRDATGRWRGTISPRDDQFTFYLVVQKRADGTYGAFVMNPERNAGLNYNADRIVVDGDKARLIGKWNGRGDERDLATGTYNAEDGVISLWLRGATYDFTRDEADESDLNARPKSAGKYAYRPPLARDDGWRVGSLEEAGIDRSAIETFVQSIIDTPPGLHAPAVEGLLIARHGKLVLEEYFHGEPRDKFHDTRSAGKVITATVAGAAIHDGTLTLQSRLLPGNADARKREITLEHLLTMRAGFFCDDSNPEAPGNESTILDEQKDPDYVHYSLAVPMASAPGGNPVYCSMMPNLALAMTGMAAKQSPLDIFDRLVARPLRITTYAWPLDPAGNPYGGGGVQFILRDFAKFGQLMLDGGVWQGQRILDRDFVARASSPLFDFNGIQYGYLWWNMEMPYKDRMVRASFAAGNGAQTVMVVPSLDLVIGIFASNYGDRAPSVHVQQEMVPDFILPAIDADGPVVFRDFQSPYGRH